MTAILFRTEISTLSLIQQKRRIGRESRASRRLLGNQKRKIEYKKDGKKRPIYYIKALLAQLKEWMHDRQGRKFKPTSVITTHLNLFFLLRREGMGVQDRVFVGERLRHLAHPMLILCSVLSVYIRISIWYYLPLDKLDDAFLVEMFFFCCSGWFCFNN